MEHGIACEKTKPIRSGVASQGSGISNLARDPSPWASAPNKPNLRGGDFEGKCRANKELGQVGSRSVPGKTKPNGSPAKLEAETNKAWDNRGRDGRGTHGRSRPCYGRVAASPRLRGDDIGTDRTSAPDKPNLGHRRANDKWFAAREIRQLRPARGDGRTRPIGQRNTHCSSIPSFHYSNPLPIARNKPSFHYYADREIGSPRGPGG